MKFCNTYKFIILLCFGMVATLFVSGCAVNGSADPQKAVAGNSVKIPEKPIAIYHDFEDVLVPIELIMVKDRTMIISSPGYKSGILTLKGRVESNSLYNFFSNNMERDNWQVLSRIKSPETTIMVYQKISRCAVITIRDEQIYTYVEISVAPTTGGNGIQKSNNLTY